MSRARTALIASGLILGAAASAAVAKPRPGEGPQLRAAWARPTAGATGMSAVYLDIQGGRAADVLTGASTPVASGLELHRSAMRDGMMGMRPVESLPTPAGGVLRLAPGGLHLMMSGVRKPLKAGDRFPVTLRFAQAGAVTVEATVRTSPPAR